MISSTLLTLLVVPVIYTILDDLKGKLKPNKLVSKNISNFHKKAEAPIGAGNALKQVLWQTEKVFSKKTMKPITDFDAKHLKGGGFS